MLKAGDSLSVVSRSSRSRIVIFALRSQDSAKDQFPFLKKASNALVLALIQLPKGKYFSLFVRGFRLFVEFFPWNRGFRSEMFRRSSVSERLFL